MTGYRHRAGLLIAMVGYVLLAHLAAWAQQPKSGGILRVAWESDVAGMDPRLSPGAQAGYVMGNLFNSLVSIDAELNYVPDLFWQAARTQVKGYVHLHGYKVRFETTWLDKP